MNESFGTRLRHQRERQGIELAAIAEQAKIKRSLLEALERDDLSHWPPGIFRRAWVRNYALTIGADADAVVHELLALHPEQPESVEAIASAIDRTSSTRRFSGSLRFMSWFRGASKPERKALPLVRQPHRELASVLSDAVPTLGAVGAVLWSWDAASSVLRPACGHGYAQAVVSSFPDVPPDADNAVAAAFRRAETCVVPGGDDLTGALAIPLMARDGCLGVLALEFRHRLESRESVRAAAARLAADVASLVAVAPQQSFVA